MFSDSYACSLVTTLSTVKILSLENVDHICVLNKVLTRFPWLKKLYVSVSYSLSLFITFYFGSLLLLLYINAYFSLSSKTNYAFICFQVLRQFGSAGDYDKLKCIECLELHLKKVVVKCYSLHFKS